MSQPKKTTFSLKFTVEGFPSRWEINSIKLRCKNEVKRTLLNVLSLQIDINCQQCGFLNTCNPAKYKTERWYCRSCGHVILYDDAVVKK
jgi:DNA-directed RNA polymerase subunit RPC12/RpoP